MQSTTDVPASDIMHNGTPEAAVSASTTPGPEKPLTLYPATILGGAMVARGEIGFLISSLANGRGLFSADTSGNMPTESESNSIFLIITWAIMLCTIFGPLAVGFLVRRLKALEERAKTGADPEGVQRNVLGNWGVE